MGVWYHYCGTYDGEGTSKLFVDGEFISEDTTTTIQNVSRGNSHIGSRDGYNYEFHGYIDDVRVYDYALEEGDIESLINGYGVEEGGDAKYILNDPLDVNGDLYLLGGTLDVSGSNYQVRVGGTWFQKGGEFVERSGIVVLDGSDQGVYGGETFYNLSKVSIVEDTLYFEKSTTVTVSGTVRLKGSSGQLLSLRSSEEGYQWSLDPQGTRDIAYVDVKDGINEQEDFFIQPVGSINSYNNLRWFGVYLRGKSNLTSGTTISVALGSEVVECEW